MAASKLSVSERQHRKRTAARLRQQRCRARKRLAQLQKQKIPPSPSTKQSRVKSLPPKKRIPSIITTSSPITLPLTQPETVSGAVSLDSWSDYNFPRSNLDRSNSFDSNESCSDNKTDSSSLYSANSSPSPLPSSPNLPLQEPTTKLSNKNKEFLAVDAMLSLGRPTNTGCMHGIVKPLSRYPTPMSAWLPYMLTEQPTFYPMIQHRGSFSTEYLYHVPRAA